MGVTNPHRPVHQMSTRDEALRLVLDEGVTLSEAARRVSTEERTVSRQTVGRWVRQHLNDDPDAATHVPGPPEGTDPVAWYRRLVETNRDLHGMMAAGARKAAEKARGSDARGFAIATGIMQDKVALALRQLADAEQQARAATAGPSGAVPAALGYALNRLYLDELGLLDAVEGSGGYPGFVGLVARRFAAAHERASEEWPLPDGVTVIDLLGRGYFLPGVEVETTDAEREAVDQVRRAVAEVFVQMEDVTDEEDDALTETDDEEAEEAEVVVDTGDVTDQAPAGDDEAATDEGGSDTEAQGDGTGDGTDWTLVDRILGRYRQDVPKGPPERDREPEGGPTIHVPKGPTEVPRTPADEMDRLRREGPVPPAGRPDDEWWVG